MQLRDTFRYLVGGYYGVCLIDEYPLKEYMLKLLIVLNGVKKNFIMKDYCSLKMSKNMKKKLF